MDLYDMMLAVDGCWLLGSIASFRTSSQRGGWVVTSFYPNLVSLMGEVPLGFWQCSLRRSRKLAQSPEHTEILLFSAQPRG